MQSTLIDSFLAGTAINPAAPAIIAGDGVISHRQLLSLVGAAARSLHGEGVRPGDMLGVSMYHISLHCVAVLALARLGAVSVPFPVEMGPEVRDRLVRAYGIRTMISNTPASPGQPFRVITLGTISAGPEDADLGFIDFRPAPETPLRIALTSGTTKTPRGVLHSNADWMRRIERTVVDCDRTSRLIPPDLHITVSMVFAHGVLCAGGSLVLPRTSNRDDLVMTVNQSAVTHLIMAPANILPMAAILPDSGVMLPTLKQLRLVGTTPSPGLLARLRQHCTPNLCVPYGITELGPVALANPATLAKFPGSAGPVLPWARVEILDGRGKAAPTGVSGEIRIAVDHMPSGYFRDDDADRKFRDGWFYPGDRARLAADGLLFIEGRIDDILNVGGHKISPEDLEAALCEHPGVADAAVHMLATANGETCLTALIVRTPGKSVDDLPEYARQRLKFLAPERYLLLPSLPRNAMGKLQRDRLQQLVTISAGDRRT